MGRPIIEIAREACERHATAPAPGSLFDSNSRIARILRQAAYDVMREFVLSPAWQGQSDFTSTWAFALQPGKYAYPLPPDFLRMVENTEHRGGWPMGLVGPATPQTWAWWIFGQQASAAPMGWRVRNGVLLVEPTPTAAELVTVEYITRFAVVSDARFPQDYDITTKPPKPKAPFVPRDGHIDVPNYQQLALLPEDVFGFDTTPGWDYTKWAEEVAERLKAINPASSLAPHPQVRRERFTTDNDRPAFTDDHVLSLGLTYHLRRALGLPYTEAAADYETEMDAVKAADGSTGRSFRIGCGSSMVETIPLGDGRWLVS